MQHVKLFMFEGCPHCAKAEKILSELLAEKRYEGIEIERIDEHKDPETADRYDYFLVPTFFVGEKKIHEGRVERSDVVRVLEAALTS